MPDQLIQQSQTAIASFHSPSTQKVVKGINNRILAHLQLVGKATRNEIKDALGLTDRQCSCGCSHLLTANKIRVCGAKVNPVSNHPVEVLMINDTPEIIFKKVSDKEKIKEIRIRISNSAIGDEHDKLAIDILKIINQ